MHRTCKLDSGGVAVLEHCLAQLETCDSSTAVSAVTCRSGVLVTILGHCQALPYDTASVKDFTKCEKFWSSAPSAARQYSHSVYYLAKDIHSEQWLGYQVTT